MFAIRDNFPDGMKITQIPISWFRAVSAFLNNLAAGTGIRIDKPSTPSTETPTVISVNDEYVAAAVRKYAPRLEVVGSGDGGAADAEDTSESGNPVAPSLAADDDSGGDTLSDGDAIDTTNYPDAENDTLRWMNNAAANELGSWDPDGNNGQGAGTGTWTGPNDATMEDPWLPTASGANDPTWSHHKALDVLIFARSKECGEDELHFARHARIDATGRLRYTGAEVCISRALKKAVLTAQSVLRSIVVTSSSGNVGVVDLNNTSYTSFAAAVNGIVAATTVPFPDQASAISGVVWRAGHGEGYEEATVSRIEPFWYNSSYGYVKIFTHVKRFSPSGLLYEVADEVDTGLVFQNYVIRPQSQ